MRFPPHPNYPQVLAGMTQRPTRDNFSSDTVVPTEGSRSIFHNLHCLQNERRHRLRRQATCDHWAAPTTMFCKTCVASKLHPRHLETQAGTSRAADAHVGHEFGISGCRDCHLFSQAARAASQLHNIPSRSIELSRSSTSKLEGSKRASNNL